MRIVLAAVAVLLLILAPAAHGQTKPAETVSLLVPKDVATVGLQAEAAASADVTWKRIVVSVDGTVERTVAGLQRELGATVLVERSYPLLGGEDEPSFGEQWSLENTGQRGGTPDADIDAQQAWSVATGGGVVVAVVDSGVNANHPDLMGQVIHGWDFADGDNDPSPGGNSAEESHGTFIAGIIAASVNGVGIAGVAPDAKILNIRACSNGECLTLDAVDAIFYAVQHGADIINLSFGAPFPVGSTDHPLEEAIEFARQRDVLVVTAAGNTPPDDLGSNFMIAPAEFPHANNVAVAATDRRDGMWSDSYYGPNIDIAAPGAEILSTGLNAWGEGNGTSFSAPHVAGVAALLKSTDLTMGHRELAARLKAWAERPAGVSGKVESGRVNAANVLLFRFTDTRGHIFESDAKWASDNGVTKGCNPPENTMFCPNESVTRGQMAAFLNRYLDLPAASRDHFDDDNGSTLEDDINRLAEARITRGCNPPANDRFCPDHPVTREQMAAFLVRALGLSTDTHRGFSDVSSSNIFKSDIERLATAGITRGCNPPQNTQFCPRSEVTRGQMTAFLHRAEG